MVKTKISSKTPKAKKKKVEDHIDTRARRAADTVMETVLAQSQAETDTIRLDEWVPIECPHCGEATEIHVIADMDGQSLDQDCTVCCRPYLAHVEIDEGEAHVGVEAA